MTKSNWRGDATRGKMFGVGYLIGGAYWMPPALQS